MPKRHAQPPGSFLGYQLAHTVDFECGALDEFGDLGQIAAAARFLDRGPHHARARKRPR